MLEYILIGLATISLIVLLIYQLYFFRRLNFLKGNTTLFNEPVSIIICAKNEAENLANNLPEVLTQDYTKFEVIVVNDQSSDGTAGVLKNLAAKHPNLLVVTIDKHINHRKGKKFALTLGIKTAKYEYLLLSDADCKPSSKLWAKQMLKHFNNADIVLGYGGYQKRNGLLNKIIRFDTFNVAQQYLSYALAGIPYMGVGRNMAYKKSLFFDNKGFANHLHIPSGDDDLFIQEVATGTNTTIEINSEAHTSSVVIENWKDWIYQKRRHLSTAPFYKTKFKLLLALYPYTQLLFWAAIIFLFLIEAPVAILSILLAIKLLSSYIVNYKIIRHLGLLDLYLIHPLYEILFLLIQGIFVVLNLFSKPKQWKR